MVNGKYYRLTEDIERHPKCADGVTEYCGYKGQRVRFVKHDSGLSIVRNEGTHLSYWVKNEQLEEL